MTSFINTNLGSINSQRHLNTSQASLSTSLERLSSGLRINNARDDAAGMSISERFTSQIKGVNQAGRNANDAISMTQVAEGSLATTSDNLQRVRELAVQAANATNTASDRRTIQDEVNQLLSEMDRTARTTQFNGMNLMDGTASNMAFQVGANTNQTINVTNANFRTYAYGNNTMGAKAATATDTSGDMVLGTTALTQLSSASAARRATGAAFSILGATGAVDLTPTANDSAKKVAALINTKSATTNVSATAITSIDMSFTAASSYSLTVQSNQISSQPVTIAFSVGPLATDLADAVSAFNGVSGSTGVTAKLNDTGAGIVITNASGEDITLVGTASNGTGTITTDAGSGAGTLATTGTLVCVGELKLDSNQSFGISGATALGWFVGTAQNSSLQAVNTIDVSSTAGATRALSQIDGALASIDKQRGLYGAMQSRFANAVSNLQSASENMSASRSRIQDTDFASETASLTRGQILQQAGTAMLAQANSLPNGVLALLRG